MLHTIKRNLDPSRRTLVVLPTGAHVMAAVFGDIWAIPGFSEPLSSWTHLIGAVVVALSSPWLMREARNSAQRAVARVFLTTAVLLLSMSGVFHLLDPAGMPREVFLRLDHAAIWLLIVGSITPIVLAATPPGWRRWLGFASVWSIAITGVVLKTIYFADFPEWLSLGLYLALGWVGAVFAIKIRRDHGARLTRWLIIGGVVYSTGAALDFARVPTIVEHVFGPHELFHLTVLGGVAAHWIFTLELLRAHRHAHRLPSPEPQPKQDPQRIHSHEPSTSPTT